MPNRACRRFLQLLSPLPVLVAAGVLAPGASASPRPPERAREAATGRDTSHASPVEIEPGSGSFLLEGGSGYGERTVRVFYHRPREFSPESPVILVVPGAGRNGDDYRDAWVEASEEYGLLVLSPRYPERYYPEYWSYNLAGMTSRVTIELTARIDTDPDEWKLDDAAAALDSALAVHPHELFGHGAFGRLLQQMVLLNAADRIVDARPRAAGVEVNPDRRDWLFADFDRIFETAREALDLEAESYDMFGHSAGGQILHRLVLFRPNSRADRILAANSGWYTVPTFDVDFPYGLGDTPATEDQLRESFAADLVLFLGELDDADETRGSLRGGPADRQGPGRLSRGRYFHHRAREAADELETDLRWKIEVVPGVGHDYRRMSRAAADYLYGRGGER